MSVDPTRPDSTDETAARIPLTPPPPRSTEFDAAPETGAAAAGEETTGQGAAGQRAAHPDAPGPSAPAASAPAANASETSAQAPSTPNANRRLPARPSPRTGPIVWGSLILVFCGYVLQQVLGGGGLDVAGWITATIIGLGVLLLGVGFAVVIRGRRDTSHRP